MNYEWRNVARPTPPFAVTVAVLAIGLALVWWVL